MLVDANILLFARDSDSAFHDGARTWLVGALNGPTRVGLAWQSLVAFLRISTHPRAFRRPLSPAEAVNQVTDWLDAPAAWVPLETESHSRVLLELAERYQLSGNLVTDAHLAALAIEHGLTLVSADTDFARFSELTWLNPLAA